MLMDATAYWEQRNRQNAEDRYKLGLERAATGEGQLASMIGSEKAKKEFSLMDLARGGPAQARRPYLVGEKGPELMVPDQNGTIIPNRKLQVIARAKKRAVARARGGRVTAGGEPEDVNPTWPGPVKAAAERAAGLAAGEPSLGSPESYGGGRRTVAPQLQEGQLSTGAQRFIPIDREADQPASSWQSGGQLPGSYAAPRPGYDLSEKDRNTGYDPSKPSFSNPIHIIRRMASTWQGPEPGQEYRTLARANQAFIRAGQGEALPGTIAGYDPVEGPRIRAEAEKLAAVARAEAEVYNRRPDLAALAKRTQQEMAEYAGDRSVADLKGWFDSNFGKFDSSTGKTVFKPADEATSMDARAAELVAKREGMAGRDGAQAGINHFQERQAIRSYLKSPDFMKNVQNPFAFNANAYLGAVSQNPAAWKELVEKSRAMRVTAPPEPQVSIGRRLWETPTPYGIAGP